jgi:uncharacterized protein
MATIRVEVVYALPQGEESANVALAAGATAAQAVRASGILARHPDIEPLRLGIYGRVVSGDTALADGDRVEIYRPLVVDPKEARRRRAAGKL